MDSVVKILADAAVKSMLGTMTAPAKDELTQVMTKATMDGLLEAATKVGTQPTAEPVRFRSGQFRDWDRFPKGSSTVIIYLLADVSSFYGWKISK